MKKPFLLLIVFLLFSSFAEAQHYRRGYEENGALSNTSRFAFSQNLADYVMLGTLNANLQFSVHRDITIEAGLRYNNWTWQQRQQNQFQNRLQAYYIGMRWWPWYTYSGWWVAGKLQYMEYNQGGLLSEATEEGDAFGVSLGGGYALHINRWLNLEFGIFGWGGYTKYITYACPYCGRRTGSGGKFFLQPDEVRISLQFIF